MSVYGLKNKEKKRKDVRIEIDSYVYVQAIGRNKPKYNAGERKTFQEAKKKTENDINVCTMEIVVQYLNDTGKYYKKHLQVQFLI